MNSLRKWLYKPKKTDTTQLAQFYFADEELNTVAAELDSFDSRKDPERCQALVAHLRACQDKVLTIIQRMMDEAIPYTRTCRDFRVKFPDDVVQENLAGQLWFGAECLAAGSSIMNRELESASMRPLARALTKNLDSLRHMLRDQCLININDYSERIREALTIFDKLFAEFELSYVSAMVPVKSVKEYEIIQEITVLFSETTIRAKTRNYITTDMIDEYDPALMFTIPRLAIVCGLLVFSDGPLNPDNPSLNMSDMFRPFQTLLYKIRELLFTLSEAELLMLERALCSQEEPDFLSSTSPSAAPSSSSSSSKTTSASTSTTTIAVQTDSPVLKLKAEKRTDDLCHSNRNCSDGISLTGDEHRRAGRSGYVEEIICQPSRMPETLPSEAALCDVEDNAVGPADVSHQSKNLNKSDSNDSGLHSDVMSTSDSQLTISSSDSSQLASQSGLASPLQSPLIDEVMELCMDEGDAVLNLATNDQCDPILAKESSSFDDGDGCAYESGAADNDWKTSTHGDGLCAVYDREGDGLSTEEEGSWYTASSSVSPLHQPHLSRDTAVPSPLADALEARDSSAAAVEGSGEGNDDSRQFESHRTTGQTSCIQGCAQNTADHVLEEVYKLIGHSGQKDVIDEDLSDDYAGDLNASLTDSTLTDLTLSFETGLTPIDDASLGGFPHNDVSSSVVGCGSSHDDVTSSAVCCSCPHDVNIGSSQGASNGSPHGDDSNSAINCSCPHGDVICGSPHSDFSSSAVRCGSLCSVHGSVLPQASCDNEFSNQKHLPESCDSICMSDSGDVNLTVATASNPAHMNTDCSSSEIKSETKSDLSKAETEADLPHTETKSDLSHTEKEANPDRDMSHTETNPDMYLPETKTESDQSHMQCDRCTQTSHSAINNSQSSKIHHHHNHNRQHSNPSLTNPATPVSPDSASPNSASNRQNSSKTNNEKRDSLVTEKMASSTNAKASSSSSSATVKKQVSEKTKNQRLARKGAHNPKLHKPSSHRSQTQKSRSQHEVPGNEARLHQYEDNWSNSSNTSERKQRRERPGKAVTAETSSGSSCCEESSSTSDSESEEESCGSSETSSYNSESHDDEEIALAVQAAELANRNQARARFRSSSDMIHRLFVCISGVADQLQTNFAGDLRNILRVVFNLNCSEPVVMEDEKTFRRHRRRGARFFHQQLEGGNGPQHRGLRDAPTWIPDDQSTMCMSCKTPFTFVRRRHHCRNCGKIFCGRCSSNAVSLPHFGHSKPVRVCNHCFVFQVNPFALQAQI